MHDACPCISSALGDAPAFRGARALAHNEKSVAHSALSLSCSGGGNERRPSRRDQLDLVVEGAPS